jgi:hypothetical protein
MRRSILLTILLTAEWVEFCAGQAPAGADLDERGNVGITVDYPCDGEAVLRDESANGDYIGVAMTVEAQPALAGYQSPFGGNVFSMSGRFRRGFAIVGADGFTEEGIAGGYEPLTRAPRTTTGSRSSPRPRVT